MGLGVPGEVKSLGVEAGERRKFFVCICFKRMCVCV